MSDTFLLYFIKQKKGSSGIKLYYILISYTHTHTHIPGVKKKKKKEPKKKNSYLQLKKESYVEMKTLVHYILLHNCNRMCCIHCCKTCSVYSSFVIVIKTIDLKLNADAVM